jgi:hypothetical protein
LISGTQKIQIECSMITNNLLHLHMTEKSIMLSIVETEEGMEIHINEKAYGNFGLVGLIEQIKLSLLSDTEIKPEKKETSVSTPVITIGQKYDA